MVGESQVCNTSVTQDPTVCPENAQAGWQYYDGTSYVADQGGDALLRCSDCDTFPAEQECRQYLPSLPSHTGLSFTCSDLLQ